MCTTCFDLLNLFMDFRQNCISSDEILRDVVDRNETMSTSIEIKDILDAKQVIPEIPNQVQPNVNEKDETGDFMLVELDHYVDDWNVEDTPINPK